MRKIHQNSDGTYGVPRITAELRDEEGPAVNRKRVPRIMVAPPGSRAFVCVAGTAPPSRTRVEGTSTASDATSPLPR
ncbi:hypothetical protein SMICM17S_07401 [Streptomyces microflavus]